MKKRKIWLEKDMNKRRIRRGEGYDDEEKDEKKRRIWRGVGSEEEDKDKMKRRKIRRRREGYEEKN